MWAAGGGLIQLTTDNIFVVQGGHTTIDGEFLLVNYQLSLTSGVWSFLTAEPQPGQRSHSYSATFPGNRKLLIAGGSFATDPATWILQVETDSSTGKEELVWLNIPSATFHFTRASASAIMIPDSS